ncbi:oxygenase MpaB family protein [Microbacterium sp. M3]|uniref:Oxygenase MpaB family protein n=1 Tax=Microbacterium arthrosphaerae TaxID=792652 RepID=A0ABU4H1C7_9MICO|nr:MULTISPECIES: oxygenase MpaB family protein [Microbacterium]MDW4573137.1 oxygenase MpaB family protein [Microbacterium arthrosphaerae]MDW7606992.1 oxygenase MpaB family protein [Microbacterium sp. M3]
MTDVNRRSVLTLGAALGLAGAVVPKAASATTGAVSERSWTWAPSQSVVGSGSGVDPQWVWDDEIDQIIATITDSGQTAQVNAAMDGWVNNWQPVPAGLPPEISGWLNGHMQLPAWADRTKLRRAADFNRRKDTYLFMIYGVGGGIMSTVIPREARSVYHSKGGADMQDRAAKTFSFGYDLSDLNAFENTGEFIVTANRTRMVHAAVRHLLPQSPHWQASGHDEEIPISNHDILVTFHSTGTFAHKKLKEWKVPMSRADEDAFLHSWQVALHFLGVRDEYIPATWDAAHAQAAQILTPILAPTTEGKYLAEVLLGLVAQVDLGVTRGFLNEFVRYQLGNDVGDWLGLKRDYVAAATIRVGWPSYILFREGLIRIMPANFYLFDQLLRAIAMAFLNKGQSGTTTPITIPDMNRPTS